MFRKIITVVFACFALNAFAATEVNQASQAELESLRGVGPSLATKILDARKTGTFKNWPDLVERVRGVGPASAARLSKAGLTVGGNTFDPQAMPAKAAKAPRANKGSKPAKSENSNKAKSAGDKVATPA